MEALEIMETVKTCPDVIDCIADDHESMLSVVRRLQEPNLEISRKRAIFKRFLPLYEAHSHAEEISVMEEGLQHDSLRPAILDCLEAHEVSDILLARIRLAVDNEQWMARVNSFCTLIAHHLKHDRNETLPAMRAAFTQDEREMLGRRYLAGRNNHRVLPALELAPAPTSILYDQTGKVGYLIAWALGVPAWILLLVFLVRG